MPKSGIHQLVQPDEDLARIVGKKPLTRADITKRIWAYIHKHELQDPDDKRQILANDDFQPLFGARDSVSMFDLAKIVSAHVTPV